MTNKVVTSKKHEKFYRKRMYNIVKEIVTESGTHMVQSNMYTHKKESILKRY